MDDDIFAHKPRLLDVAAQLQRSAHAALGLAISCAVIPVAGQRTHGTTFRALKVTSLVATPGAESAVCDCLVVDGTSLRQLIIVFLLSSLSETAALRARKLPSLLL